MVSEEQINALRRELKEVRDASLAASRAGNFMKVARLTARAASLNRSIMDAVDDLAAARYKASQDDAR
jgi:cell division FtsZ-interacting protein ZapD